MQKPRTETERENKLTALAKRAKSTVEAVLASYNNGDDILDPAIFATEDIEEFAREYKIDKDPMVQAFIKRSRPISAWA